MTPAQAKKTTKEALDCRGMSYTKITARTVSFSDLARGSMVFVSVFGSTPSPCWKDVDFIARNAGFRVDAR